MEIYNDNYCVYVHTNKIDNRKYVGQTCQNVDSRWRDGKGYQESPYFYNVIQKYGWDNFEHEVIASHLTKEEADNFEKLLINKLNTMDRLYGYNLKEGGSNGKLSEESRKKISETLKNIYVDKTKCAMYGKHHSEETKRKNSESHKGMFAGEKNYFYGKTYCGATNPRARKIAQLDMNGNYIRSWEYIRQASNELGINPAGISDCCRGKGKTSGGFKWMYLEDYEKLQNS